MKVLAADGISPKGIELLQKEFEVDVRDKISAEELLEIIPQYDALMVRSASKVTAEVINRAEKLKIIGRAGVGVDNIDIPAATAKGIIVINSPGGNTIAATEHTMAMMLAMSRNIPIANETMQKGEWNRKQYVGVELRNKTLGVIGMGRIGSGVAKRAMAFDMNVIAYDVNKNLTLEKYVKYVSLNELLKQSDLISLHCPLTEDNYHMIDEAAISKMKDGVILVNTSRGSLIDTSDLIKGIRAGKFHGVGLDVYEEETDYIYADHSNEILPNPATSKLLDYPNVVMTSHQGFYTKEALRAIAETTLQNATDADKYVCTANDI